MPVSSIAPAVIATVISALVTTIIAVAGWVVGHRTNVRRDALQMRKDLRVRYLLDAYRRVEDSTGRSLEDVPGAKRAIESASADIQVLGTKAQIAVLLPYLAGFSKGETRIEPLLKILRDDLRKELGLEQGVPEIHQFRFATSVAPPPQASKPGLTATIPSSASLPSESETQQ
jgi:hypothetical protein